MKEQSIGLKTLRNNPEKNIARGVPHPAYIPSVSTPFNESLFNEKRRTENDEKRELGLTGSAYRKMKKRERRDGRVEV